MATYVMKESIDIPVPADIVYKIIADYGDHDHGHRQILPPAYFSDLKLKKGEVGAGTEFDFKVTMAGQEQRLDCVVTEPEPGRILVETNSNDSVTTFIVEPLPGDGNRCKVTFDTVGQTAAGLQGWIEAKLAPRLLKKVYVAEQERLKALAISLQN